MRSAAGAGWEADGGARARPDDDDEGEDDGDAVAALQSELAEICVAGKMFERARAWAEAAVATTERAREPSRTAGTKRRG